MRRRRPDGWRELLLRIRLLFWYWGWISLIRWVKLQSVILVFWQESSLFVGVLGAWTCHCKPSFPKFSLLSRWSFFDRMFLSSSPSFCHFFLTSEHTSKPTPRLSPIFYFLSMPFGTFLLRHSNNIGAFRLCRYDTLKVRARNQV